MAWKLCLVLLTLQISCLLADEDVSLTKLLLNLIQQKSHDSHESDGSHSGEDHADPRQALERYLKAHHIESNEDPINNLVENYLEKQDDLVEFYKMLQGSDLIVKSILKEITHDHEVDDFAINLVLEKLKASSKPADDSKHIMAMLIHYLMEHPKVENKEMFMNLLHGLIAQQSPEDQGVLRVMILHRLRMAKGELREFLIEFFKGLMTSEDFGVELMRPQDMLMLLVQQLGGKQMRFGANEKAIGMLIMSKLSERRDTQGLAMLRHYITNLILGDLKPNDVPEEDQWKYSGSGPCLVEDQSGEEVFSHMCPHDFECDVGAATYRFNDKDLKYFMCHFPDEYIEYFAYHACEVTYPGGITEKRSVCFNSECNLGPYFRTIGDDTYQATFCGSYANYTQFDSEWDTAIIRACALEDVNSGIRPLQRRCPSGQHCGGHPLDVEFDGYPFHAYMCQRMHSHEDRDLAMTFINTMLGFRQEEGDDTMSDSMSDEEGLDEGEGMLDEGEDGLDEGEDGLDEGKDGLDEGEDGLDEGDDNMLDEDGISHEDDHNMIGGLKVAHMMEGKSAQEFLNYIILQLWKHMQNHGDSPMMGPMGQHMDRQDLELLKYLMEMNHNDNENLDHFVDIAGKKHHFGIIDKADRVYLHAIIRSQLIQWKTMQQGGEPHSYEDSDENSRSGGMDDLMAFLDHHHNEHAKIREELEDQEDHMKDHEKMHEGLEDLIHMINGGHDEGSHHDDDDDDSHHDDDSHEKMTEEEVIKFVLEHLLKAEH